MFCTDLWGFSIDPPYFGYNSAEREIPVLCIWCFRNIRKLKFTEAFSGVNTFTWEATWEEEVWEWPTRALMSKGGVGPSAGRATPAHLALVPPMSSVFPLDCSGWPKNPIYRSPKAFSQGGGGETWNHKIEAIPVKIGGETLSESPLFACPTSPTSPTFPPWWRGSSLPLDYGFVAVACSIYLLCYDV
jgi:hypothetical protein